MRDDFSKAIATELARRAGYRCSNPSCQSPTVGPSGATGSASIGVASHIAAAAPGGPRHDKSQSSEQRSGIENGIWLCQKCSRLIDSDVAGHATVLLLEWRELANMRAALALRGLEIVARRGFAELEGKMPELFEEMRQDLADAPFTREFIAMSNTWSYNGPAHPYFNYFFEDHEHLLGKLKVCVNYGAIVETTSNEVSRYEFTEDFVEYLGRTSRSDI